MEERRLFRNKMCHSSFFSLSLYFSWRGERRRWEKNNSPRNTGRRDGRTGITRAANVRVYGKEKRKRGRNISKWRGETSSFSPLFLRETGE